MQVMIDDILYSKLLFLIKKQITENKMGRVDSESQDLVNYIKKIAKYDFERLSGSSPGGYDHVIKYSIDNFYFEFVKQLGKTNIFDESLFTKLYPDFENLVYDKARISHYALVDWRIESPLIINEMKLRSTNQTELEDIFRDINLQNGIFETDYFIIETETNKKINFDILIDALNVFKNNFGRIYVTAFIPMKYYPCEIYGMGQPPNRRSSVNYNPPTLFDSEVNEFKIFYNLFKKYNKQAQMKIAIERYNLGMQAVSFDDSIIDFMIALECLFGGNTELTYRISTRIALLLGTTEEETEEIRTFMINVYSIRSKITHGEQEAKMDKMKKLDIPNELKKIVNKCLKAFFNLLDENMDISTIKSELDQCISFPSKRPKLQEKAIIST